MKLILAVTKTGGIAKDGKIPWNIPDELSHFKKMTSGHVVIMGRKTFESIKKPLSDRINIVVGKNHTPLNEAVAKGFELENKGKTVWVIGGSEIAEAFSRWIDEAFISVINEDYDCDTFAPQYVLDSISTIDRLFNKKQCINEDNCSACIHSTHKEYTVYQCFYNENQEERNFQTLIQTIVDEGVDHGDRTGVGTRSIFGHQLQFSLENGRFPMSTLRRCFFKGIFEELMWFFRGQTDSNILSNKGIKIWEGNSTREALDKLGLTHLEVGDCGSIYGHQWRHWGSKYVDCKTDYTGQGIDQISNLISEIKKNPFSRRLLVSGWNVEDLGNMCLPPCHTFYQFDVSPSTDGGPNYLSCHYYQRSSDVLLAGHWNITSAALFTILLAHFCGLRPKKLVASYGNAHIYNNHRHSIAEHLQRFPFEYPSIVVNPISIRNNLWDYQIEDVSVKNYKTHTSISLDMNA
jgi:dihydrofolate reductase/thymidylate synthase